MWETDDKQPRKVSADERRVMIVDEVNSRTSIHVSDICEHFGISGVTARSDLDKLERAGKLRRTHGGAVSITRTITISYPDQRMNLNVDAKRKVAECAADGRTENKGNAEDGAGFAERRNASVGRRDVGNVGLRHHNV